MNPISHIAKTPSELVLDLLKDFKTDRFLQEDQLVSAKVLRLLPQGKAQLQIMNQVVDVKTQIPLTENETLYLKVTKSGDSKVLKLVESYKPVTISQGLSEVRALGSGGPYEILAKVLNTPLEGRTAESVPLMKPDRTGTAVFGKESSLPQPPLTETTPPAPLVRAAPAILTDQQALMAFVAKKSLPQSLKLALVITQNPREMSDIPLTTIRNLSQSLDTALRQKKQEPVADPKETNALPIRDKTTALALLAQKTRALFNHLEPSDKTLAEQFIKGRTLSPAGKLAALLNTSTPSKGQDTLLPDIKNSLIKAFFPKGLPQSEDQIPNLKAQALSQPAMQSSPTGSSVFTDSQVLQNLRELIGTMALNPKEPFNAETLLTLVRNSGLLWERKLKNVVEARMTGKETVSLKEQLTTLMQKDIKALSMNAQDTDKHPVAKTLETLKHFVDNVEKLQVLNSHTGEDSGRYLLPLPFFSGDKLKFGQLFIDTDKKKQKESTNTDRIIRVAFMLEMSELGHVEADISVFKKSLSGEFVVGQANVKERFDEALPGLFLDLAHKGYSVSRLECRLEKPEILATHCLADRMAEGGDGAVSIVV